MPRKPATDKEIVVSAAVPARRKPAAPKRAKRAIAAPEAPVTQPIATLPTQEQIAALAYTYYQERGGQGGSPEQDWLRAERELIAKTVAVATATA